MIREWKLPARFLDKLQDSDIWFANVINTLNNVEDYFYETPYYFPEYTNHGILHIRKVIDLCNKMIPDKALEEIMPRELGILLIAAITHDIGMFIKPDGLETLLFGEFSDTKTRILDKYTWGEAWQSYLHDVMRYSDKKLLRIFGKTDVKLPGEIDKVDDSYQLVYGDFLRQYHPRLAFEIINRGFMGKVGINILRDTKIDTQIRELIALAARSHGMSLRDVHDYLAEHFTPPEEPKNIRIYYIMAVLRMADYLDAGYDRASHVIGAMQGKRSSASEEEYSWNQIIDYEDYAWNYKAETLYIHAEPSCSSQFLKIESWLRELQKELDLSWAVLGEYYVSKHDLPLRIRRINSNILEEKTRKHFEQQFVTRKAVLDTNPDILKLLVYPLYNEDPGFGVRELLQNAVDACNERRELEQQAGNGQYTPRIIVKVNRKNETFQITDNGIGMDSDVIINYFLISGASFRNSDIWEGKFKRQGNSVIARTGKFGIGVLATFLLGSEATIITRSMAEERGYTFDIEIGRENINIERVKAEIGTTITVKSTEAVLEQLILKTDYPKWTEWYCFQRPDVEYWLDGERIINEEEWAPDENEKFDGWFELPGTEFRSYKWSYSHLENCPVNVFCNGIPVPKGGILNAKPYGFPLSSPALSIVDYNNVLRINLSREQLTEFPREKEFVREGFKFVIMKLLTVNEIESFQSLGHALRVGFKYGNEYGLNRLGQTHTSPYLFGPRGFTLMSPAFLRQADVSKLMLVCVKSHYIDRFRPEECGLPIWLCEMGERGRRRFYGQAFSAIFQKDDMKEMVSQFIVEREYFDTELKDYFISEGIMERLTLKSSHDEYYNFSVDGSACSQVEMFDVGFSHMKASGILSALCYEIKNHASPNLMSELLDEYLGEDIWIPYASDNRRKKYPQVFEKLDFFM